jgi:hypothetical protein
MKAFLESRPWSLPLFSTIAKTPCGHETVNGEPGNPLHRRLRYVHHANKDEGGAAALGRGHGAAQLRAEAAAIFAHFLHRPARYDLSTVT